MTGSKQDRSAPSCARRNGGWAKANGYGGVSVVALAALIGAGALAPVRASAQTQAENTVTPVEVTASASTAITTANEPNPVNTVGREGLSVFGGPAQASSFQAVELIPGVIANSADPYGLSFTRALNVRGKSDFFLSRDIDGLPIVGIVGGTDPVDLEDVAAETVYAGPVLADQGFGVSDATGVLDETLLGPQAKAGGLIDTGIGSDDFHRVFARFDTGRLSTGTSLFFSGSTSEADKWKGAGNAWRNNIAVGLSQSFGDQLNADIYYIRNVQKANSYLALTYAQTQSLGQFYNTDYLTSLAGVAASSLNKYYDLNKQNFADDTVLADVTYRFSADASLTVKPYYWHDVGVNESASGTAIRYWPQDKTNAGVVAEFRDRIGPHFDLSAGYWYQSMSPDPPPVKQKNYNVLSDGSLQFASWATLGKFTNHLFNAPYLQLTGTFGDTAVTGGVRYLIETSPAMTYFVTKGLGDLSYQAALAAGPPVDPNGVVAARDYYEFLPNLGLHHQFTKDVSLDVSYSKKVARVDYGPQASSFFGAESTFVARGFTLTSLMQGLRPETDDDLDVVLNFNNGRWIVTPDFYVYSAHNKEVLIDDPRFNQAYYQSNASTTGYGLDLTVGYRLSNALTAYLGVSAAKETYDNDILLQGTGAPTTLHIKGNQVPNDPQFTVKGSLTYRADGFTVTPVFRYIGQRYGLADNSQKVKPNTVVDVVASYDLAPITSVHGLTLNFSVLNLFDEQYIDVLSVNEDNLASISYYAGAPRTLSGGLSLKF